MVPFMIIMLDEALDLLLQITRQKVVLKQHAVLQRLMPTLDFALRLRMIRSASDVAHTVVIDVLRKFAGDITRAII